MIHGPLICNPTATDSRIVRLSEKLLEFYACGADYTAFQLPAAHYREWAAMMPICDQLLEKHERIAVLELGAGRSAFGTALGPRRSLVDYDVQDVTAANADYLHGIADRVFEKPVECLSGAYDLIFSTFVLEHIPTPASFLHNVRRLLKPGGWHVIFCPRYDSPIYECPSLRRVSVPLRCAAAVQLLVGQAMAVIDRKPRFYINVNPAVLNGPWFRDADAVHLVTRRAVELWHEQNGFRCRRLRVPATTPGEWLQVAVMLLANAFQKV